MMLLPNSDKAGISPVLVIATIHHHNILYWWPTPQKSKVFA